MEEILPPRTQAGRIPLSQILGSLSHALDLTEGQPQGHATRTCLIGMGLARELALREAGMSHLYYSLLLKDAGCSSNAHATARFFGSDDHRIKRNLKTEEGTHPLRAIRFGIRNAAAGEGLGVRIRHLLGMARGKHGSARGLTRIRCERGADISRSRGFPEPTAQAVRGLDQHWDGRGEPEGLAREEIPLLARIVSLA